MKISKEALDGAVEQGILETDQAEALLTYLRARPAAEPRFDLTSVRSGRSTSTRLPAERTHACRHH